MSAEIVQILFWLLIALMTAAALAVVLWPLLRISTDPATRADYNRRVYRDQMRELDTDMERGVVTPAEAAGARLEIERRLLSTVEDGGRTAPSPVAAREGGARRAAALSVLVILPAVGLGLYTWLGSPGVPGRAPSARFHPPLTAGQTASPPRMPIAQNAAPGQARPAQAQGQQAAQSQSGMDLSDAQAAHNLDENILKLRQRLEANPGDIQGWMLLGRSLAVVNRHADAMGAFRRAAELAPDDPDIKTAAAEAMVLANGGQVNDEAAKLFREALEQEPSHPAGRYYLALARAQAGGFREAFDMWRSLLLDSPADAPWRDVVENRLRDMGERLGIDVSNLVPPAAPRAQAAMPARPQPQPTPQDNPRGSPQAGQPARGPSAADVAAAQNMSAEDRTAMIRGMVEGLAARLEKEPNDLEGWQRLARAYGVLGETEKAAQANARVAALSRPAPQGGAPQAGAQMPSASTPNAQTPSPARGPRAADVAAAQNMSAEDRTAMIRGMVESLAARLEKEPNDLDGWQRLARAYGVLGDTEKAAQANARIASLLPDDVGALLNYAAGLIQSRPAGAPFPEPAITAFKRILSINPNNPGAVYYLALADAEAGRSVEARSSLQKLLERLDPASPSYNAVRQALDSIR